MPSPAPGPDEVLVRVHCGSVNHVDTFVRSGAWSTAVPFPLTVGRDAVGEVVRAGPEAAEAFVPGMRVWTNSLGYDGRDGALAEFVVVQRERLYHLPDGVSWQDMAGLCHPAATAYLALFRHGCLQPGAVLLVVGAGGNVGWAAVVSGRHAGARVIATAHPRDHGALLAAGADEVVDYRDDLVAALRGRGVDLVVDTAGVNDLTAYCEVVHAGGRIVLMAGMSTRAEVPVGRVYLKNLTVTGFTISQAGVEELARAACFVNAVVTERGLRPRRLVVRSLDEVAQAHAQLEAGRVSGKQVVLVGPGD